MFLFFGDSLADGVFEPAFAVGILNVGTPDQKMTLASAGECGGNRQTE